MGSSPSSLHAAGTTTTTTPSAVSSTKGSQTSRVHPIARFSLSNNNNNGGGGLHSMPASARPLTNAAAPATANAAFLPPITGNGYASTSASRKQVGQSVGGVNSVVGSFTLKPPSPPSSNSSGRLSFSSTRTTPDNPNPTPFAFCPVPPTASAPSTAVTPSSETRVQSFHDNAAVPTPPSQVRAFSFAPLPPTSAASANGTSSGRQRKNLAIRTSAVDAPIPAPVFPAYTAPPAPLPSSTVTAFTPYNNEVFDTSFADSRLPSSGVASPNSLSPHPAAVDHGPRIHPHNIVGPCHPFLMPFGAQQTHAMQVEDAMEEIMDAPLSSISLEVDPTSRHAADSRLRHAFSSLLAANQHIAFSQAQQQQAQMQQQQQQQQQAQEGGAEHARSGSLGTRAAATMVPGSAHSVMESPANTSTSALDSSSIGSSPNSSRAASAGGHRSGAFSLSQSFGHTLSPRNLQTHQVPIHPPHYMPHSGGSSAISSSTSLQLATAAATTLPLEVALPVVQAAMYDDNTPEYQQYKSAWAADRELAAREALRASNLERAVQQGLLPRHHVRKTSRSMFSDMPPGFVRSGATSPASLSFDSSPQPQPLSPSIQLRRHRGHTHSGYVSPSAHLRSISPMGSPRSPTIFATLVEANSRSQSRTMSPLQPASPSSHSGSTNARTRQLFAMPGHMETASGLSLSGSASAAGSGPSSPPRHPETALYDCYDNLRLGWIPSDLALTGAIPVPFK